MIIRIFPFRYDSAGLSLEIQPHLQYYCGSIFHLTRPISVAKSFYKSPEPAITAAPVNRRTLRAHNGHRHKGFPMKQLQCIVCGFIYDEELGLPEDGIAPGTRWEDVPDDWMCPDCGVGKDDFEMVEF